MPIFVGVRGLNYFSCSVIISPLISIAPLFPMSLLHTGAAPVTKLLLIAGRTDTPLTGIPVISRRAGKRKSILRSFRTHKDHAPFFYIIDLSKKRFNTNNQKTSKDTQQKSVIIHNKNIN